jgi:hypothetical protein
MSFRDYLHEKAEESRHNETLSYLMFVAGAILFIGGILTTLNITTQPDWFIIIPYYTKPDPGTFLALSLVFSGIALTIFGIATGLLCSHERGWYMKELQKASSMDDAMLHKQTGNSSRNKKNSKA